MKNITKTHFIIFTLTFLLLIVFYGLYLLIRVKNASYPEEVYYFEEGTPTSGQMLIIGFKNSDVIIESLITSVIVTILNYFIKIRQMGPFVTSLKFTFLVTLVYFLYKLASAINFDREYFDIFLEELKEEIQILAVLFFVCSILTMGLTNKLKKEI